MGKICLLSSFLIILFFFLFIGLVSAHSISTHTSICNGNTFFVGGSGSGNYTFIQDAIDDASAGDTILVYSRIYYEHLIVDKQLFIKGIQRNGEEPPTIDAGSTNDVVIINADGCLFENFKVKNVAGGYNHRGIVLNSDYNTIKQYISYETGYGIVLQSSSYNSITNNELSAIHNCIILDDSNNNAIFNNEMYPKNGDGLIIRHNSNNNTVFNNLISSSLYGSGVVHSDSVNNIFSKNSISSNNRKGMILDASLYVTLSNNIFIKNCLAIYGDSSEHWDSHMMVNNTVNDNVLYVHSHKNNFTISSNAGQVILYNCSAGIVEGNTIHDVEIGISLTLCSNITIRENSIISNHYRNMDEGCIHVVQSHHIIIEKNQIDNGQRGVYSVVSHTLTIINNAIVNHDIGIWFNSPSSNNVLSNNHISQCRYGIGFFVPSTEPKVFDTIISGNIILSCTTGIWTYLMANTVISDNTVSNSRLGIKVDGAKHCIISGNTIKRNINGVYVNGRYVTVQDNNFIFNIIHAFFREPPEEIEWDHNYWGRPRIAPKLIPGIVIRDKFNISPTYDIDNNPRLVAYIISH